jgi:spore maturation protein CgeB
LSGYERVNYKRYLLELLTSKIVLSPFGWGEVCIRDYEAVACGALLMKPDMTHVSTQPDIFKANETYVPLKWDFSDLDEKVDYYISHPDEARRIALAGQRYLLTYFKQKRFLKDFKYYLEG